MIGHNSHKKWDSVELLPLLTGRFLLSLYIIFLLGSWAGLNRELPIEILLFGYISIMTASLWQTRRFLGFVMRYLSEDK